MLSVRCAFYGSLRRPMYNYKNLLVQFGQDSVRYLCTTSVAGFDMYSVTPAYPCIKPSSPDKKIVVDLFVLSEEAHYHVKVMEENAGYYEDEVLIDGINYKIFPFGMKTKEEDLVTSGDWLKFCNVNSYGY